MYGQKPARLAIRSAVLLPILLLLACTEVEGGGAGGSGDRPPTAGSACTVDAECAAVGLRCDPERHICVCTSDASCPGALQCDPFSGRCVEQAAGCRGDADCDAGHWCDTFSRSCRVRRAFCEPCDQAGDCGAGNECRPDPAGGRGFCGAACTSDGSCPRPGTRCNAGQCEPAPGEDCASVAACIPDDRGACAGDADCDSSQRCDAGACVARRSGCASGQRCDAGDGVCYTPCDADGDGVGDCTANERCVQRTCHGGQPCEGRVCVALAPCAVHADCPPPNVCRVDPGGSDGRCVPGCVTDDACPLGFVCASVDGRGVCEPGCKRHGDCLPDQLCEGGACVGGGGRCQTNDACGACERCVDGRCASALGGTVPGANYCATCSDVSPQTTCGAGGLCRYGWCEPACPPEGCPRGFVCEVARDAEGAVFTVCSPQDQICITECL